MNPAILYVAARLYPLLRCRHTEPVYSYDIKPYDTRKPGIYGFRGPLVTRHVRCERWLHGGSKHTV